MVLLELLIGRKALDKSRPSREHNLVEWARPLLNNNKKLLRILDPRLEGQYSNKAAMKVAHLAYQCLSQNPKGRPLMSQVVDILETFQSKAENHEEAMLQSGGSLTLYEVPKGTSVTQSQKREPFRSERAPEVRSSKPGKGRSKSEPFNDADVYSPSPDLLSSEKSASTRR